MQNIIFDLCGPIVTIDVGLISAKMQTFGAFDKDAYWSLHAAGLTRQFEANHITPECFCNEVRRTLQCELTDQQIFEAWNTLIVSFPMEHVDLLKRLSERYRLFMLSNCDVVNARFFHDELNRRAGFDFLEAVFEHAYFSCELKMRKPNPDIFRYIVEHHGLDPKETLVIDDCPKHVDSACGVGLCAFLLSGGTDITQLFDENLDFIV